MLESIDTLDLVQNISEAGLASSERDNGYHFPGFVILGFLGLPLFCLSFGGLPAYTYIYIYIYSSLPIYIDRWI